MYSIMYTMCTVYNVGYRKLKMSPLHLKKRIQYRQRDGKREHNRAEKKNVAKKRKSFQHEKFDFCGIRSQTADNQAKRFLLTKKSEMFSSRNVYYLMDINYFVML